MARRSNNVLKIYLDLKGDYTSKDVVEFKPSMMSQRSQNLGDTIYFTKTIKYTKALFKKDLFKKILVDNVGITEDPLRYFASRVKFNEMRGKLNKLVRKARAAAAAGAAAAAAAPAAGAAAAAAAPAAGAAAAGAEAAGAEAAAAGAEAAAEAEQLAKGIWLSLENNNKKTTTNLNDMRRYVRESLEDAGITDKKTQDDLIDKIEKKLHHDSTGPCDGNIPIECKEQNAMFLVKLLFKKNDEIWIPNAAGTRKMYYISNVDIRNIGIRDQIGADETVVVSLTLLNSNKPPGSIANRAYDCRTKLKDIKDIVKDKVKDKIGNAWLSSNGDDDVDSDDDVDLNASVRRIRKKTLHDQYYKVATELENIQYEKWDLMHARGNQDSRVTRASKTRVLVRKENSLQRKLQEIERLLGDEGMRGLRGRRDRYHMPFAHRGRPNQYDTHDYDMPYYGMPDYFGVRAAIRNKKNFTRRRTRIKKARHTKGARVKVKMSRRRKPKNTRRK